MNYVQGPFGPQPPAALQPAAPIFAPALIAGIAALAGSMYGFAQMLSAAAALRVVERMRTAGDGVDWDTQELECQVRLLSGSLFVVLLGLGGVLLLARQAAGRTMVIVGSALGFCSAATAAFTEEHAHLLILDAMIALGALAVLTAAVLPSTQRWVSAANTHVVPYPHP